VKDIRVEIYILGAPGMKLHHHILRIPTPILDGAHLPPRRNTGPGASGLGASTDTDVLPILQLPHGIIFQAVTANQVQPPPVLWGHDAEGSVVAVARISAKRRVIQRTHASGLRYVKHSALVTHQIGFVEFLAMAAIAFVDVIGVVGHPLTRLTADAHDHLCPCFFDHQIVADAVLDDVAVT